MHKIINKDEILTIPNLLSLFRLLLVPVIIWLYCVKQNYIGTIAVFTLSAVTDIADGIIARKFNMVSDFGKILDPIADKVTQGSLIICLIIKYKLMLALIGIFLLKEITMAVLGYFVIKRNNNVNSAKWHGKVNTILLYAVMVTLILFPALPLTVANLLICVCGASMIFSFVLYVLFYKSIW